MVLHRTTGGGGETDPRSTVIEIEKRVEIDGDGERGRGDVVDDGVKRPTPSQDFVRLEVSETGEDLEGAAYRRQ